MIPLDAERGWYRYHHLFLDPFRSRTKQTVESVANLPVRASDWFERNGLPPEAFGHAIAAGDTDRAAEILEGDGLPLHYRGVFAPVADVENIFAPAETAVCGMPPGPRRDDLRGQIPANRALLAIPVQELEPIIANTQTAIELLDKRNGPVRAAVAWKLRYAHQILDEFDAARTAFERALSEGQVSGNLVITIGVPVTLGQFYERENRLGMATQAYLEALRLAGHPPLPYACAAYLGLVHAHSEQNDLVRARDNARPAREIGLRLENVDTPALAALIDPSVRTDVGLQHLLRYQRSDDHREQRRSNRRCERRNRPDHD